jgi:sugar/nucleoside kinase (ribokinase family)
MIVDVLGMGAVAMDLLLRCEDLPGEDGFAFVHKEEWLPGGSCSNVLVTLASMGARCAVAAQIGDDSYGDAVRADLSQAGISTEQLLTRRGGTTLHTFIAVARNGARAIFASLGDAFLNLPDSRVGREMLHDTRVFYTDMFAAKAALKLARLCREMDIPVVFNLECSPSFMESCRVSREELEEMLSLCHLFCAGREGLRGLTPFEDEREAAAYLRDKYAPHGGVVATLGEKGAFWAGMGESISVPAFEVAPIDTTGAGDAFAGGLMYARLLRMRDMGPSLEFANACGAVKCLQAGPRLKATREEIEAFMEAHGNGRA